MGWVWTQNVYQNSDEKLTLTLVFGIFQFSSPSISHYLTDSMTIGMNSVPKDSISSFLQNTKENGLLRKPTHVDRDLFDNSDNLVFLGLLKSFYFRNGRW